MNTDPADPLPTGPLPPHDRLWDIARLVLNVVVLFLAGFALLQGLTFRPLAAYFPIAAAGMIVVFVVVQTGMDLFNFVKGRPVVITGMDVESSIHGKGLAGLLLALRYIGWFVGYLLLLYVTGVFVSAAVFLGGFLRLEARWSWRRVAIAIVGALVASYVLLSGLGLAAPRTMLDIGHGLL